MDETILLITFLEDDPEIERFHSHAELERAIEDYELDPACYGTDWVVALPLAMKPTFRLPIGPPAHPTAKEPNHEPDTRSTPGTRNRTRPAR